VILKFSWHGRWRGPLAGAAFKLEGARSDAVLVLGLDTSLRSRPARKTEGCSPTATVMRITDPARHIRRATTAAPYDWGLFLPLSHNARLTPPANFRALAGQ